MVDPVTNNIVGKIVNFLFSTAKQEIDYVLNCNKNVEKLESETKILKDMMGRIQQRITAAGEKGEVLLDGVEDWMKEANTKISDVELFLEEEAKAEKTCFNLRPCVNLGTYSHYSKMATNKTASLQNLQKAGKPHEKCVSIPTPTPRWVDLYQPKNLDGIDSHKLALRDTIQAIKDESNQIVGIYGSGGVGKTTLAKEVAVKMKNLFADIVFITVSQTEDVEKIKKNVEVAAKRISKGEKVLIILDDIWKKLDLPDLGIPCGNDHRNCKILLTSRKINVYEAMNVDKKIPVNILIPTEAWILFKRVVGDEKIANQDRLEQIANDVSKECGGLPLLIEAVGNALKNKPIDRWVAALKQLQKNAPVDIDPEIRQAFTKLKLSYDLLGSEVAKWCFLMCSMFKEDGIIDMLRLAEYGVALQKFNNPDSINDAEESAQMAVDILTSSSLLLSEGDKVKMHDVVRGVALFITSSSQGEEKDKFLVEAGKNLTEWRPRNRTSDSYTKISLMNNRISKLPDHQLHFPHLDTFLIRSNYLSIIPDDFFEGMKEVKVLDMSLNEIISLPKSLKLLTKLITLDLSGNESLDEISILGELKGLEILKVRGTGIKVIPKEIGQLIKLRLLDAAECYYLSHVTPGVISELTWLEELYIIGTDEENAVSRLCLMDIKKLKLFRALHFSTYSNACHLFPPEGTYFELMLQEFYFQFIDIDTERCLYKTDFDRSKSHLKRRLRFARSNFPFKMPIKKLFQVSDGIELDDIDDLDNIIPDLYGESIDKLKSIKLYCSKNVSCLVKTRDEDEDATQTFVASNHLMLGQRKTTKEKFFSQVEEIRLHNLKNLKLLFDCSFQYISLRNLLDIEISYCASLLTVFPLSVAQGLSNLRRIQIWDCSSLEVVISGGDERTTGSDIEQTEDIENEVGIHDANIEFRTLTHIELTNLPQLKSFYSGDSTIKYPSLKFIQVKNCPSMKSRWGHGVDDMLNVEDIPNVDDMPKHNFKPKEGKLLPTRG